MTIRKKDSSSSSLPKKLTPEEVRAKIVEEILGTERDYVKHLEDIIEVILIVYCQENIWTPEIRYPCCSKAVYIT